MLGESAVRDPEDVHLRPRHPFPLTGILEPGNPLPTWVAVSVIHIITRWSRVMKPRGYPGSRQYQDLVSFGLERTVGGWSITRVQELLVFLG